VIVYVLIGVTASVVSRFPTAEKRHATLKLPLEDSPYLLDDHGPVFVCGCPRSGTTFLSKCIGSIHEIEEFVGVLAPPRILHTIGYNTSMRNERESEQLLRIIRDIFWQAFWRRILFRAERAAQIIYRRKPALWFFKRPMLEGRYFCYKEPFLAFAIEQMCAHFSAAKVIHIVRDGRDTADSMVRCYPDALSDAVIQNRELALNKNAEIGCLKRYLDYYLPWWVRGGEEEHFIQSSPYGRYIWMWREMVERVQKCGQSLESGRYLELRYESVVSEPEKNARQVLEFLGFSASVSLLRQLRKGRTISIGISKRNQSNEAIAEAHQIAGPLLKALQYD
jgi:hypothetical protein